MSQWLQVWAEVLFNVAYLAVVWALVVAMLRRYPYLPSESRRLGLLFIWAFALLALGDTGHVGFRVLAYAIGNLETTFVVWGVEVGLVGAGVFSTSVTVTLFYVMILVIWQERFAKPYGWFGKLLFAAAVVRLGMMFLPQNEWNRVVSPQPWATYRNLPLVIQGLGVAFLMIRDAVERGDRVFKWVGAMILVSYAFYVPAVLLVERVPALGMLMIPKTMAYVVLAWMGFVEVFRAAELREGRAAT
jgi:hypothetical protein